MRDACDEMTAARARWSAGKPVLSDGVVRYGHPRETSEPSVPGFEDEVIERLEKPND